MGPRVFSYLQRPARTSRASKNIQITLGASPSVAATDVTYDPGTFLKRNLRLGSVNRARKKNGGEERDKNERHGAHFSFRFSVPYSLIKIDPVRFCFCICICICFCICFCGSWTSRSPGIIDVSAIELRKDPLGTKSVACVASRSNSCSGVFEELSRHGACLRATRNSDIVVFMMDGTPSTDRNEFSS